MFANIWLTSALIVTAIFSASALYKSYSDIQEAKQIQEHYELVTDIKTLIAKQYNKNPQDVTRAEIIAHLSSYDKNTNSYVVKGNWDKILLLDRNETSDLSNKEFVNSEGKIVLDENDKLKLLALKAKLKDTYNVNSDDFKPNSTTKKYTFDAGFNKSIKQKDISIDNSLEQMITYLIQKTIYDTSTTVDTSFLNTTITTYLPKNDIYQDLTDVGLSTDSVDTKKSIFFKSLLKERLKKESEYIGIKIILYIERFIMIKYFSLFILFYNFIFALDLTTFDDRQKAIQEIKKIILKEELFSKAYEEYILENYSFPNSGSLVGTSSLLESNFLDEIDTDLFNKISITAVTTLSYSLKTVLSNDAQLKTLYESNTFRKRTFVSGTNIIFKLEDDFAKQLSYLISKQTSGIPDCDSLNTVKYCKKNNHIYIFKTAISTDLDNTVTQNNILMYYHKDKFKTGPIIISSDTALYSNMEYSFIPKGAILYDTDGIKYVKTINSIEQVR